MTIAALIGAVGRLLNALITNQDVSSANLTTAIASYAVNSNGTVTGNGVVLETWLQVGTNADFEVRATKSGPGSTPSGTLATWLPLTSNQIWTLTASTAGTILTATLLVEIRLTGGATVSSANVFLSAERYSSGGGGGGGGV